MPVSMKNSETSGTFLAVLGGGDVDGFAARVHDGGVVAVVGADEDAAGEEVPCVEASGVVDPEEAVLVDVGDVEADLVHVAEQHDDRCVGLAGT